jgi:hypothetical protein
VLHFIIKTLLSALIIAGVSEIAKRSTLLGGVFASLPLMTPLSLVWLHVDGADAARLAAFSWSVLWMELPSLVLLAVLPLLLQAQWRFPVALAVATLAMIGAYLITAAALKRFGMDN